MKKNIYPRLAITGMVKNSRMYVPYLMTCICMIFVNYLLDFLRLNKRIAEIRGGTTLQSMLSLGSGIFCIFAMIFLFYTNSFLIRSRKREFGLYNILGMGKWNMEHCANSDLGESFHAADFSCGRTWDRTAALKAW